MAKMLFAILIDIFLISIMLTIVEIYQNATIFHLGIVCALINIISFSSPLAGIVCNFKIKI